MDLPDTQSSSDWNDLRSYAIRELSISHSSSPRTQPNGRDIFQYFRDALGVGQSSETHGSKLNEKKNLRRDKNEDKLIYLF